MAAADAAEHKKQLDASTRDKASLAHALELRAADLSSEAGEDVPSRLLYAVAKGREESVSLAVQLAEKSDALERAARALSHLARGHGVNKRRIAGEDGIAALIGLLAPDRKRRPWNVRLASLSASWRAVAVASSPTSASADVAPHAASEAAPRELCGAGCAPMCVLYALLATPDLASYFRRGTDALERNDGETLGSGGALARHGAANGRDVPDFRGS